MNKFDNVYKEFIEEAIFKNKYRFTGEPAYIDDKKPLDAKEREIMHNWAMGDPETRAKWEVKSWRSEPSPYEAVPEPLEQQPEFNFEDTEKPKLKLRSRLPVADTEKTPEEPAAGEQPPAGAEPNPQGELPFNTPEEPVKSTYLDKLKSFGRRVSTGIQDFADDPGPLAGGLAKIGGYDARETRKELDVAISDVTSVQNLISGDPDSTPQGVTNNYFYKKINLGTPSYNNFVQKIRELNPEAASRFERSIRKLDSTKENFIRVKSSLPGVGMKGIILVGKIGNDVYAYFPKTGSEET